MLAQYDAPVDVCVVCLAVQHIIYVLPYLAKPLAAIHTTTQFNAKVHCCNRAKEIVCPKSKSKYEKKKGGRN